MSNKPASPAPGRRLPGNNITINRSPLRSIGSKGRLIQKHNMMDYFPPCIAWKHWNADKTKRIIHRRTYVELFCGSATVFFNLDPEPLYAVLNDANHNIFNFWNVIATKYDEFIKELEYTWCGEDWIEKFSKRQDEIGMAMVFYIRNRYENLIRVPVVFPKEVQFTDWKARLDHCRLHVWNLDYKAAMAKIDKNTFKQDDNCMEYLIYEDPPYVGTEDFYTGFNDHDHDVLAKINHETTHHVLLTYNDCEKVRDLYKDWHVAEMQNYSHFKTAYNTELLLSNRPIKARDLKTRSPQATLI